MAPKVKAKDKVKAQSKAYTALHWTVRVRCLLKANPAKPRPATIEALRSIYEQHRPRNCGGRSLLSEDERAVLALADKVVRAADARARAAARSAALRASKTEEVAAMRAGLRAQLSCQEVHAKRAGGDYTSVAGLRRRLARARPQRRRPTVFGP